MKQRILKLTEIGFFFTAWNKTDEFFRRSQSSKICFQGTHTEIEMLTQHLIRALIQLRNDRCIGKIDQKK